MKGALKDRVRDKIRAAPLVLIIILLAYLAWQRNHVWMDDLSLWRDVVKGSPYSPRAWFNLSLACEGSGDMECAMDAIKRSIELYPEPAAFMRLGFLMEYRDNLKEAELLYNEAINRAEQDSITDEMKRFVKRQSYYGLGSLYFKRDSLREAEYYYRMTVEIDPEFSYAWNDLGYVLMKLRRCEEARNALLKALELSPEDRLARENLELLKECK